MLPVMETFYSLQGEGFHAGKPAFFARIGGCDVACSWCDSKESWNAALHPMVSVQSILSQALEVPARAMVITGGEPLQYKLDILCRTLKQHGFELFLETSGSAVLSGVWDWICLSPKKKAPPLPEICKKADELKVIIYDQRDFLWAEEMAEKVEPACIRFLQPEWSRRETMTPDIVRYIREHPQWRISMQLHKYLRIP